MKKSVFTLYLAATLTTFSACLFSACHTYEVVVPPPTTIKDTTTDTQEYMRYADDHAISEQIVEDLQDIEHVAFLTTTSHDFEPRGCATVTHSASTITIDYGATNCMCFYGRNRRGKIIINFTGAYTDSGSTYTTTFDNFYEDDKKVEGTKTTTNMGYDSSGDAYMHIMVNATVTKKDGNKLAIQWTRVRTSAENFIPHTPLSLWTLIYRITGSGSMTGPSGTVTSEIPIAAPLVAQRNCRWIEGGFVAYKMPDGATSTLRYSTADPGCDDDATVVSPNGATITSIKLP